MHKCYLSLNEYPLFCCFSLLDRDSTFALAGSADTHFELSPEARAQADLKFTYVVTCQIYGKQKGEGKPEAADIALLMQRCFWFYVLEMSLLVLLSLFVKNLWGLVSSVSLSPQAHKRMHTNSEGPFVLLFVVLHNL